jgi:hypothetical protein
MGYRQSSFDPNAAWGEPGKPLRPFNWVQWTGVGFEIFGAAAIFTCLLGRIGVIPKVIDDFIPFISFLPLGAVLMNSRREPSTAMTSEQLARRRRILLVILAVAVLAALAGFAAAFFLRGA